MTSRTLEEIGLDYKIVVEDSEYDNYAAVIDPRKIIALPTDFRQNPKWAIPDILGQCGGGIPVRNFIWEHSINAGASRHWILDDNIRFFFRSHKNTRLRCYSSAPLRVVEDFTDRFENMAMSGLNYYYFMPANEPRAAYTLNTRIYSCILLDNSVKHRWRGLYNEDTDLSLSILKSGYCTALFNSFTCGKMTTHSMKGGNTDTVYKVGTEDYDGRFMFAESLRQMHPDCVSVVKKWGRTHHLVDYDRFAMNIPIPKPGLKLTGKVNEYGLRLVRMKEYSGMEPEAIINPDVGGFSIADKE